MRHQLVGPLQRASSVADVRKEAERRLPRPVFDFIEGGADDECTLRRNEKSWIDMQFAPRVLRDVSSRSLSTTVLGENVAAPIFFCPTGLASLAWPNADTILAQAAARRGLPFALSTSADCEIEVLSAATSHLRAQNWFQLYVFKDRRVTFDLIERAAAAGFSTLVVTVDVPVLGKRERDVRNGFTVPISFSPKQWVETAQRPAWISRFLRNGAPKLRNFSRYSAADSIEGLATWINGELDPSTTWTDVEAIRSRWKRSLVVKGILTAGDALRAVGAGADAVALSNHGGRQLDGAISPLSSLREVVAQVPNNIDVLIDGGVRRGSDVVKALCLGARSVGIGRPLLYGLGAAGERGVELVLDILIDEIDRTLALLGVRSVTELDVSSLRV